MNGLYNTYHPNGKIMEEGTYIDGKIEGVFKEYDENGKLIVQSHWKNTALNGKLTHWRDVDKGILMETTQYKDNMRVYSCTFDEMSRITGNYFYEVINGVNVCTKSIEYKRRNGFVYIATATAFPRSYTEEVVPIVD